MRKSLLITSAVILCSNPTAAHHSRANFLLTETMELEGTISEVNWRNPHVYFDIDVENEDDTNTTWTIETAATMQLKRLGWSDDSLQVGDRIWLNGSPDRNEDKKFFIGSTFRLEDGTVLSMDSVLTGELPDTIIPPGEYTSLESALPGVYQYFLPPAPPDQDRFGNRLAAEAGWPLTEKASAIAASYNANTDNPVAKCLPYVTPYHWKLPYLQQIDLTNDGVVFIHEYGYIVRTAPLNQPMPDSADSSYQGISVAYWDGPELVVDTAYYSEHPWGVARGIPAGKLKKTEERFRLNEEGEIEITITVTDPEYLTEPTARTYKMTRVDSVIEENDCDLDAAQRYTQP